MGKTTLDLQPATLDLELYEGDDNSIKITFTDTTTGDPVTLSTTGWSGTVKQSRVSDTAGTVTVDATQAATGIVYISFPTSLPAGRYVYDVTSSTDSRTWLQGSIVVYQDVT